MFKVSLDLPKYIRCVMISMHKSNKAIIRWLIFLISISWIASPLAATLLVIKSPGERSQIIENLEFLTHSFGIGILDLSTDSGEISKIPSRENVSGIIITGSAYNSMYWPAFEHNILKLKQFKSLPILVVDLTEESNSNHIPRALSGNGMSLGELPKTKNSECFYEMVGSSGISKELEGLSFPCDKRTNEKAYYFNKQADIDFENIIEVSIPEITERYPIFFKAIRNNREMFFLTKVPITKNENKELIESFSSNFIGFAPLAMFIRHVSGEYSWHADAYYANFTIDDPWLREPYGSLSYHGLLKEMEKTTFHTTIAFVPWNFDRSDSSVVSLIKNNPHRFSISVHGNNHDHEEFEDKRPIETHEKNIRQGLARMDEFKKMTGLEYDKVMVFPHQIAALEVIGLLRKYSFACTANLQYRRHNVESKKPAHLWGGFVAEEEGIPSLKRELPYTPKEYLAILLFLQTPILLHTHQEFFGNGISEFSKVADTINELRPDIQWVGLGSLCENLYLKKLEDDGRYRVLLFANKTIVRNTKHENRMFILEKSLPPKLKISEVWVNGTKASYTSLKDKIQFEIGINGFDKAIILFKYKEEIETIDPVEIRKNDLLVWVLRYVSDFRDVVIGQTSLGRTFTKAYYKLSNGHYRETGGVILFGGLIMAGFLIAFTVMSLRRLRRSISLRFGTHLARHKEPKTKSRNPR